MAEITDQAPFQGLILPRAEIAHANISVADSVYTERIPRPGIPVPDQEGSAEIVVTGDAAAETRDIRIQAGGMPDTGATFAHKLTTDSDYVGWDHPNVIQQVEHANHPSDGFSGNAAPVRLPNGDLLFVCHDHGEPSWRFYSVVYDVSAGTWSSPAIVISDSDYSVLSARHSPALMLDDRGRVLAFCPKGFGSTAVLQIDVWAADVGDDLTDSNSWSVYALDVLPQPLKDDGGSSSRSTGRIRACSVGGSILLLVEQQLGSGHTAASEWILKQYASSDGGATFDLVVDTEAAATATTGLRARPDCVTLANGLALVGWITQGSGDTNADRPTGVLLANAYDSLADATEIALSSVSFASTPNELSIVLDENGRTPYVYVTNGAAMTALNLYKPVHVDPSRWYDAAEFQPWGAHVLATQASGNLTIEGWYDRNGGSPTTGAGLVAGMAGGSVWVLGYAARRDIDATHRRAMILRLGGWNTLTLVEDPTSGRASGGGQIAYDEHVVVAAEDAGGGASLKPENSGYTLTGTSISFDTVNNRWQWNLSAANGDYQVNPSGAIADGMIAAFAISLASAGDLTSTKVALRLRLADGTDDYEVEIRFASTGFRVYDANGTATLVDVSGLTLSNEHHIRVALRAGNLQVDYRVGNVTAWTNALSSTAVTNDNSTPDANNLVRWGHITSGTENSRWGWFGYGMSIGVADFVDQSLGIDKYSLVGRPLSAGPSWAAVPNLQIRQTDGPAVAHHTHEVVNRADYPADRLDLALSPKRTDEWQSVDDASEVLFVWAFDAQGSYLGPSAGAFLEGHNFRGATVEGFTGVGADVLGTFDDDVDLDQVRYRLDGAALRVALSGAGDATRYVKRDELRGGYVYLPSSKVRKIAGNTEGFWEVGAEDGTATKRPIVYLEDVDGTETATGLCDIQPPRCLLVMHEIETSYVAYGLRIPVQTTAEGYFKIGRFSLGDLVVFGTKYARGRVRRFAPSYALAEGAAGARYGRKLAEVRRAVEMRWTPRNHVQVQTDGVSPDFLNAQAGTGPAIAARADVAGLLEGILGDRAGGARLVVFLPRIEADAAAYSDNRQDAAICGRIVQDLTVSQAIVKQTELGDEQLSAGPLVISEEL